MDAQFQTGFHLLLGENAQGKTNILEAIYLVATLRSFRGAGGAQLIREGQAGYFIGATIQSDVAHECKIYWAVQQRNLTLDGQPVRRISDYLGVLRAVVFSSDDLQLIKGPGSRRRRFLDLLLTQTQASYLPLLQRYTQALRSRNALLKRSQVDDNALEAFTRELIEAGTEIIRRRHQLLPILTPLATHAYSRIASDSDLLEVSYQPSVRKDFLVELTQSRSRERVLRSTILGPHRDELLLSIQGRPADHYGSEGQKRSIAIALKMAQAEYLTQLFGSPPVLLIDDIMGELDIRRRSAFIPLLQRVDRAGSQVFMTATEENWPAEIGRTPHRWVVKAGEIRSLENSAH